MYNEEELRQMVADGKRIALTANTIFIQVPNSFMRNENLTINQKMIYLYLWGYGIDLRPSYPSHATMKKHLGLSKPTIIEILKKLEELGGVYIINRIKKKTKAKTTNLYYLAEIDNKTGCFVDESLQMIRALYPEGNKVVYID